MGDRTPRGTESRPTAGVESAGEQSASEDATAPAPMWDRQSAYSKRVIQLTMPSLWIALALILSLCVVVWVVSWKMSAAAKDREWQDSVGGGDKLVQPGLAAGASQPTVREPVANQQSVVEQPTEQPVPPPSTPPPSAEQAPGDPRQPGVNYLALATLPRNDARQAVAFLAEHGVEAIAVPVDPSSSGANNGGRYRVYSLLGIASKDYSRKRAERERHEAEIRRLGRLWQDQYHGSSDFSRTQWEKYTP